MKKLTLGLLPFLLLSLIVTAIGCGGEEEATTPTPTVSATPTPTPLKLVTELIYEADLSAIVSSPDAAIEDIINIIKYRIEAFGITGAVVESQGTNLISVQFPDVGNVSSLTYLVGQTARLEFRELSYDSWEFVQSLIDKESDFNYASLTEDGVIEWIPAIGINRRGEEVQLIGAYLERNAQVVIDPNTKEPRVAFEFNNEGTELFAQITGRLIGQPLSIFLDDEYVFSPTVMSKIEGGNGVIENIAYQDARDLAVLLNAGAFPCPLELVSRHSLE